MRNRHMSLSLTPRSGRAIGAADPRVGGPVTSMWSRENARFPGINWGAERGVKDGGAAPFAIRGNADHRIDRYAIRATQTLTGPRVGNYARFINSARSRTENLEASRCACCFCVAAERCVVTCGISATPGLSPASGVVRCILVTAEKIGRGNSNRLHELIAAQEMYRSNRGCQLRA